MSFVEVPLSGFPFREYIFKVVPWILYLRKALRSNFFQCWSFVFFCSFYFNKVKTIQDFKLFFDWRTKNLRPCCTSKIFILYFLSGASYKTYITTKTKYMFSQRENSHTLPVEWTNELLMLLRETIY